MKTAKEYITFSEFKNKTSEKLRQEINHVVNNATKNLNLQQIKNIKVAMFVAAGLTVLAAILVLVGFFAHSFTTSITFLIIGTITLFIALGLWFSLKSKIKYVQNKIQAALDIHAIYREALALVNPKFEYLGFAQDFDNQISSVELEHYRLSSIPSDAWLSTIKSKKSMLIDQKFPLTMANVVWKYTRGSGKSRQVHTVYSGIIKIDTSYLGSKQFYFSIFRKGWFGKTVKLENHEFNKKFQLDSKEELQIRKAFTPLVQELYLKRYKDTYGVLTKKFEMVSQGNSIYLIFAAPLGFMELDIPSTLDFEKMKNKIYEDIVEDVYSIYYLLYFAYLPFYLD
ncbi:DUF3137 domain-containing protein [Candidatus Mycoplasma pogonae]